MLTGAEGSLSLLGTGTGEAMLMGPLLCARTPMPRLFLHAMQTSAPCNLHAVCTAPVVGKQRR